MWTQLRDWLRARAHQHAVAAAQGEGVSYAAPPLPPYVTIIAEGEGLVSFQVETPAEHEVLAVRHQEVLVLEDPVAEQQPVELVATVPPPLAAEGHAVAVRMEQVMTNIRELNQLQFVDTLTVQAIDDEIVALEGQNGPGRMHLLTLRVIHTMLSDALNYAGNMHRLVNIYNAAPAMHAAADYLLSLRPDPPQMPDTTAPPYLPLAGGEMFGPLVLNADPRAPNEAATRHYVDVLVVDAENNANTRIARSGDKMDGVLQLQSLLPSLPDAAVPKSYVDNLLSGSNYQGTWEVAANIPDLDPTPPGITHAMRYLCVTVDPLVAELAPAGMPGIGGQPISNGAFIIWDAALAQWDYLASGGLTLADADARYLQLAGPGGLMTGAIKWLSVLAPAPADLSEHIDLWGGVFGMSVTNSELNYVVGLGNFHVYRVNGAQEIWRASVAGIIMRKGSGGQMPTIAEHNGTTPRAIVVNGGGGFSQSGDIEVRDTARYRWNSDRNTNVSQAVVSARRLDGYPLWELLAYQSGNVVGGNTEAEFRVNTAVGGWGWRQAFRTTINSPPGLYVEGTLDAADVVDRSRRSLKNSIRDVTGAEVKAAWSTLRPRRFKWNDPSPPVDENGVLLKDPKPFPPSPNKWGFVADEIGAAANDAVARDDDGTPSGYSIGQLLAITIARVKLLEAEVAALKH